jgi:hypothetical protein
VAARDTDTLLDQATALLPPELHALEPHLAALAAQIAAVEADAEAMSAQSTTTSATGVWLRLRARSFGLEPQDGESEDSVRARIWNVADALTAPSLEDAVNAVLEEHLVECQVVPHWTARPFVDSHAERYPGTLFCNGANLLGEWACGAVIVPTGLPESAYLACCAEIRRLQSAGETWFLIIEDDFAPPTTRVDTTVVTD